LEIFEEALTGTGRAAVADDSDSTESGSIALQLDGRKRGRMGPEEMEAVATRTLAAVRLRHGTVALRIADSVSQRAASASAGRWRRLDAHVPCSLGLVQPGAWPALELPLDLDGRSGAFRPRRPLCRGSLSPLQTCFGEW
jgi:hypothetical protein